MNSTNSNHPKREVPASSTLSMLGTSRDLLSEVEIASAVTPQPTMQLMSGALAASVPMESGDGQITSGSTLCHQTEKKSMSNKSVTGGKSPSKKSAARARIKDGSARGLSFSNHRLPKNFQVPMNGDSDAGREVSIAKSIFRQFEPRFFCKSKGEGDAAEREFVCQDDIQRMQVKLAAYRYSWTTPDDITSSRKSVFPQALFGDMPSSDDDSPSQIRVIFVLDEVLPSDIDTDVIMRKMGVPSGSDLVQYSHREVYALIAEVFAINGLDRSEYASVFGGADMPWICSDMCASVYKDFGDITFPPMTLSEFGNFVHALKFFNQEVALATLRRIYSNRCQA